MHKIVFSGQILSGHEPERARKKMLSMLGLAAEQEDRLFSGKQHVLKKGLSAEEAERYVAHFGKRGIAVEIDPPLQDEEMPPFPTLIFDLETEKAGAGSGASGVVSAPPVANESGASSVRRPAFKAPSRPWAKSGT